MGASPDQNTRRIARELKQLHEEEGEEGAFAVEPLEDNLREWHFALRGPDGTEFEGGVYHGRLSLPAEYPYKPPRIQFLTPNGRFQTGVDICLSISSHHPEHWQPSWGIRTALTALASFMPASPEGAIGSLDFPAHERSRLAQASRSGPPSPPGGSSERSHLMHSLHNRVLLSEPHTSPNGTQSSHYDEPSPETPRQQPECTPRGQASVSPTSPPFPSVRPTSATDASALPSAERNPLQAEQRQNSASWRGVSQLAMLALIGCAFYIAGRRLLVHIA
jgi:ubiquitin-conjugating enzyme E2 J1